MPRLLAIANPISGRGRARRMAPQFEQLARSVEMAIDFRLTEAPGHARELASGAAGDYDGVFVVGGDGTVNEVVNGLGPEGLPVAVLPLGTGNVLAKELRAPRHAMGYARALKNWNVRKRDLGRMKDGRLFTCFVGAGFDGQCTRALAEREGSMRMSQYVPIMWKAVKAADFSTLDVTAADGAGESGVSYALVSITPAYGGPLWLTPRADPADGRFDVLTVHERITPLSLTKLVGYAFVRAMGRARSTKYFRTTKVAVEAEEEVPIQVDGDFAGFLPIEVECLPGALTYFSVSRANLPGGS